MKNESDKSIPFLLPWLSLLTGIFMIACLLPPGFESVFSETGIPMPGCPFLKITGIACPLCGMTRSFVHAAHLNISMSIQMNPAGFFLFVYLVAYLIAGWLHVVSGYRLLKPFLCYQPVLMFALVTGISWVLTIAVSIGFSG